MLNVYAATIAPEPSRRTDCSSCPASRAAPAGCSGCSPDCSTTVEPSVTILRCARPAHSGQSASGEADAGGGASARALRPPPARRWAARVLAVRPREQHGQPRLSAAGAALAVAQAPLARPVGDRRAVLRRPWASSSRSAARRGSCSAAGRGSEHGCKVRVHEGWLDHRREDRVRRGMHDLLPSSTSRSAASASSPTA